MELIHDLAIKEKSKKNGKTMYARLDRPRIPRCRHTCSELIQNLIEFAQSGLHLIMCQG